MRPCLFAGNGFDHHTIAGLQLIRDNLHPICPHNPDTHVERTDAIVPLVLPYPSVARLGGLKARCEFLVAGRKMKRLFRNDDRIVNLAQAYLDVGRHSRPELQIVVVHVEDHVIRHHVLLNLRIITDLGYGRGKLVVREGRHGEDSLLPYPYLPISASSTLVYTCMRVRSSAILNSTGV